MKITLKILSAAIVLTLITVACGSSDDEKSSATFEEVTASTRGPNYGKTPEVAPGFDGETISLGVITPLSGLAGFLGKAIRDGAQTYWDAKNESGGVAGKYKVEFIEKDSGSNNSYDKTLSIQAYDDIAPDVVAFQQILGTDVVLSLEDKQLEDKKVIAPATLSGEWVRDPLTMSVANAYQTQAINGVAYFAATSGESDPTICSLALDDSFGEDGVEGVTFITDKLDLNYKTQEKFTALAPISSQVDNLISSECDAVVLVATAVDVAGVMSTFAEKNADMTIIGLAPLWIPEANIRMTTTSRAYAQDHLWVVSAGAEWGDTSVSGMALMMDAIKEHRPQQQSNPFFLYGFAQGWAMDQLLTKAVENGDLSSAGVAAALANVGTFDFEGLLPSYEYGPNTKTRIVPDENTIYKYESSDPSKLRPISDDSINFTSEFTSEFVYK
jgi:ABC-type branched-subunit amino acid transport system substrate-binding protein